MSKQSKDFRKVHKWKWRKVQNLSFNFILIIICFNEVLVTYHTWALLPTNENLTRFVEKPKNSDMIFGSYCPAHLLMEAEAISSTVCEGISILKSFLISVSQYVSPLSRGISLSQTYRDMHTENDCKNLEEDPEKRQMLSQLPHSSGCLHVQRWICVLACVGAIPSVTVTACDSAVCIRLSTRTICNNLFTLHTCGVFTYLCVCSCTVLHQVCARLSALCESDMSP